MKRSTPINKSGTTLALLAAGSGKRFGGGKLDADLDGKPLGCWAIAAAEIASFDRYLIITGEEAPSFAAGLSGWELVINHDAAQGIGTSIARASEAALGSSRLVIALADMPLVPAEHLRALANTDGAAFSSYPGGQVGVPAAFPADSFAKLATLRGKQGAASLDWGDDMSVIAPYAADALIDVDTTESLSVLRASLPQR